MPITSKSKLLKSTSIGSTSKLEKIRPVINMSLKTSLTVTATGEDAFKLLTLINEAGLGSSISVTQEEAPLEGGINLNELPGAVSDEVKEEAFAAGQGIVQMTEEDSWHYQNPY